MEKDRNSLGKNPSTGKSWQFIKRYGFLILMVAIVVTLYIIPDAKSLVLRQIIRTGIFNSSIEKGSSDTSIRSAIDFDFSDENGTVQNLSALRGKVVFINFWASWCPPCRAEFPSIEKLYTTFKDNPDIFFLTISEDSDIATARAFLDKEKYSVPLYRSNGNAPQEIYAGTLPTTVVLDKEGKVRFQHAGVADYGAKKFIKQMEKLIAE